jgi:hypothetical protein
MGRKSIVRACVRAYYCDFKVSHFLVDFFILPIDVCEVVIGTQWLRMLGPIWWDFARLLMRFRWKSRDVELRGIKPPIHRMVENKEMEREVKRRRYGWVCHIQLLDGGNREKGNLNSIELGAKSSGLGHIHQQILLLLNSFSYLFNEPQGLPPYRSHNHQILLKFEARPVNIRPYRYPHYQKNEIEKIVYELLKSGVVKPSTSPYSSLVLLVKKHDSSWRLCVDYWALNQVIIKDKFLIPVVDELLEVLHGAQVFSKLDLRSRYHHIRMGEPDVGKIAF